MAKALVVLAPGFEEVEAVIPVDLLRRAGVEVLTAALEDERLVEGSHGLVIQADTALERIPEDLDALVLPGGMPGSAHLAASERVMELVKDFENRGKILAAICAAPALVLGKAGVLEGKRFTCYPGMEEKAGSGGSYSPEALVVDGNVITAWGMGGASEFARALIRMLAGEEAADRVLKETLYDR